MTELEGDFRLPPAIFLGSSQCFLNILLDPCSSRKSDELHHTPKHLSNPLEHLKSRDLPADKHEREETDLINVNIWARSEETS